VIYDDQFASVAAALEREIRRRLPDVMAALAIPRFDIGRFEMQLTSHNDGEYYKWHTDSGTRETQTRVITFVYYFHGTPRMFTGGELVIHESADRQIAIEPENDSIVFFNSRTKHEVREVACPSRQFEDGRFTVNGWIRSRTSPRDDYFGYQIFSHPAHTRQQLPSAKPALTRPAVDPAPLQSRYEHRARDASPAAADAPAPDGGPSAAVSLLNLYSDLHRQSRRAGKVDVFERISGTEFYENYYFLNRPVVLSGAAKTSAAVQRWSPEFFARHYASVPIQITGGRDADPDYETHLSRTVRTVTMASFVERLCREEDSNDFYLVGRNYFFENPALEPLKHDLQPPPDIINTADQRRGTAKLWFGPKGTVTPLHYDEHSILFMQIYGRKRFKLIPPFDSPKLYVRKKYYSAVDPENVDLLHYPEFSKVSVAEVTVEAGDMLFLPVGWWHWARSLAVSISATFCSFHAEGGNTTLK
jgi:hypothetical protein